MSTSSLDAATDPFAVLGLDPSATAEEIRARYLELVRQNPPEREPERFGQIRTAYTLASDPIQRWSRRLCSQQLGNLDDLLARFQQRPTRLRTDALLRCGEQIVNLPQTHKAN